MPGNSGYPGVLVNPESPRDTQAHTEDDAASARSAQSWGHSRKIPQGEKYPVFEGISPSCHPRPNSNPALKRSNFPAFFPEMSSLAVPFPGIYELQVYRKYPQLGTREALCLEGNMKPFSGIAKLLSSSTTPPSAMSQAAQPWPPPLFS